MFGFGDIGVDNLENSGQMGFQGGGSEATNGDQTNGGLHTAGIDMGTGKAGLWQNIILAIVVLALIWLVLG
ncbi:hypothetical protein AAOGI_06580 [Agarivorans albus]